jgi:hypothetical protein
MICGVGVGLGQTNFGVHIGQDCPLIQAIAGQGV